jgi:hypothetical protein
VSARRDDAPLAPADLPAAIEETLEAMIAFQRTKVAAEGNRIDPRLTPDDLLMASDFPALAGDPRFNYEDGILTGLLEAQIALRSRVLRRLRFRSEA